MKKFILFCSVLSLCTYCFGFFAACEQAEASSSQNSIIGEADEDGDNPSDETTTLSEKEESLQSVGLQNGGIFKGH